MYYYFIMELAMLAGAGLLGYYFNKNESQENINLNKSVLARDIPSGADIYNNYRLDNIADQQIEMSRKKTLQSLNPKETNIIPNYFNKLAPYLNRSKTDKINIQYNENEDLDDVFVDMPFQRNSEPKKSRNQIFAETPFNAGHMFLDDEYEKFKFDVRNPPLVIPGVGQVEKVPPRYTSYWNDPIITPKGGAPWIEAQKELNRKEYFQEIPDKNLLAVSESLTDNASSLRQILTQNVDNDDGKCKRKQTPFGMYKSKRLVGVTPDYKSIKVDDEIATYPTFYPERGRTEPPAEYPSYLAQFEESRFDAQGLPSAPNDVYQTNDKTKLADLERNLAFKEGWSQYNQNTSMAYGVVPENELTHDNMMPFFSVKQGYGTNDNLNENYFNRKNELFTGNLRTTWIDKEEVRPFFDPVANLSYIYGTPVRPEGEESRYIPSIYRQNEKLFDFVRVTPGLNLKYDEIGTQGNFDMYRALPKNVDQLRTRNNPKISYEGRIIEGMRGSERPVQAPVVTYRPDGFKVTTEKDFLPNDALNDGPMVRQNFIMKETDRADQHFEYTGGAYTSSEAVGKNVPQYMREKYKYSPKPNFTLPKPLQKYSRDETIYNPNLNSYDLPTTMRNTTEQNDYLGAVHNNATNGGSYANLSDNAKHTLREISSTTPYNVGLVAPNTMRGTSYPMDIANPTIRETTENNLNPYAPSLSTKGPNVYFSDVAKTTVRETQCDPIMPLNVVQTDKTYANWTDVARMTLKQTIAEIPVTQTQVLGVGQQQGSTHLQDIARTTIKEGTSQIPYQTFAAPVGQQQRTPNPQDIARTTIREGTVQIPYETMVTPINQQQRAPNPQDIARTTIKEGTSQIPYNTMVTPMNQQQRAPHPQDIARTTIREGTSQIPYNTMVTPMNQQQRAPNPQDIARTTIREGTVQIPYEMMMTPVNQQQRAPNPQDIARTTIREGTSQIPYNTMVTPMNQQQRAPNPQDIARTTIREGTSQIPYNTMVTPMNQQQRAPNPQDVARTTIKEGTSQIPYNMMMTPMNQQQRAPNPQDVARTTIKEGTSQIPYNMMMTPVNQQQRAPNPQDVARTTIKEGTVQIPYNMMVTPVNQQQRAPNPQDVARTTIKEGTVQIPYGMMMTPVNQQQRAPNPQDVARTTIKEGTVQIPYNMMMTPVNQQQRAPNPQDVARTTIKEGTVQIPYNTMITPVDQQQRAPNPQDVARTTIKETTVQNDYIGAPSEDIYAKGFGYLAEDAYAPSTNRQFTGQEVYITPAQGDAKARSYNAEYNAEIDDRKEMLSWYHPPTASGVTIAPMKEQMNMILRRDVYKQPDPFIGYSVNNNLDRPLSEGSSFSQDRVPIDLYVDPKILKQLKDNPFNIPYFGTHYG